MAGVPMSTEELKSYFREQIRATIASGLPEEVAYGAVKCFLEFGEEAYTPAQCSEIKRWMIEEYGYKF